MLKSSNFGVGAVPPSAAPTFWQGAFRMRKRENVKFTAVAARTAVMIALLCICATVTEAATNSFETLFTFNGPNGTSPTDTLIADAQGNLYGTANQGGAHNLGIVFELTPTAQGQWKETILYSFAGGSDGVVPYAGVIFDSKGNIYGTTSGGGRYGNCTEGCGTVFQLTKEAGGTWTEQIIYAFSGKTDGYAPNGLAIDAEGNLYGTTEFGGSSNCNYGGCGTIFKLTPSTSGPWKKTLLHGFRGGRGDGAQPQAALIFDPQGNLYGTASVGGNTGCYFLGCGAVFELKPAASGRWSYKVVYFFDVAPDGFGPAGALVFDKQGTLFGTTGVGGGTSCPDYGCGTVFELTPNGDDTWTESVLYRFQGGDDGAFPYSPVAISSTGNIYVSTEAGGHPQTCSDFGCGTLEELIPSGSGTWTGTVLVHFGASPGIEPWAGLIIDANGNLYGTTREGGNNDSDAGLVFEYTP
jgi:uncharacterized repeat protein (TIGR03803 family)